MEEKESKLVKFCNSWYGALIIVGGAMVVGGIAENYITKLKDGEYHSYFNKNNVSEEYCPISLSIDWGDGIIDTEQNKLNKDYRKDSIINEVLYGKFSSIFSKDYEHVYSPSTTSLFKTLTAEITMNYANFDELVYVLPLSCVNLYFMV